MDEILLQYVLIVFLVIGLAYLIYLIKEKGIEINEDYFGITLTILNTLKQGETTNENVKRIIRAVSNVVIFIESNYNDETNYVKEENALLLAREAINNLNLNSKIDDESIRQLIRLTCAILPPTSKA